ncbi:MAG: PD40 domain-containing protein [Leptospirales bacterium]|nr:PD40 domain-containing protein [Leptospirales bacterium]
MRLTGLPLAIVALLLIDCASSRNAPATNQNRSGPTSHESQVPADTPLTEAVSRDEARLKVARERSAMFHPHLDITQAMHDEFLEFQDRVLTAEQIKTLTKIAESDKAPLSRRFLAIESLAGSEVKRGDLKAAQDVWTRNKVPGLEKHSSAIIAILAQGRGNSKLTNLAGNVNTDLAEYDAVMELSGKRIYFTRYNQNQRLSDPPGEDIYLAEKQKDGTWNATAVSQLNSKSHESVLGISSDGGTLSLFGNYPGSLGAGDIFESKLTASGWSAPRPMPPPINSVHFDSDASFSPDGKAVIFVSDRAGGYYPFHARQKEFFAGGKNGNTDLYVSFRKPDGSFSLPRNLGPVVNTPGSERNPFLHADGKTLYFSSEGHPGLGGHDVFRTVRMDDTWTNWTEPVNLGPAVNGPGDDSGFRITAHGDSGLISGSLSDTKGPSDVFLVAPLPPQAKPKEDVTILRGKVKSASGDPVEASVKWNSEGKEEGQSRSRPDTGEYLIPLAMNKKYDIAIEKEGFFKQTFPIDTAPAKLKSRDVEIPVAMKVDPEYKPPKTETAEVARSESSEAKKPGPTSTAARSEGEPKQREMLPLILPEIKTASATRTDKVTPAREPGKQNIRPVAQIVYFNPNGLRMMNPGVLKSVVLNLKSNPRNRVFIEAHTDSLGTGQYNKNLSEQRARKVFQFLTGQGISPKRIGYRGIGENRPASSNRTARGRKLNRRAIVTVIPG